MRGIEVFTSSIKNMAAQTTYALPKLTNAGADAAAKTSRPLDRISLSKDFLNHLSFNEMMAKSMQPKLNKLVEVGAPASKEIVVTIDKLLANKSRSDKDVFQAYTEVNFKRAELRYALNDAKYCGPQVDEVTKISNNVDMFVPVGGSVVGRADAVRNMEWMRSSFVRIEEILSGDVSLAPWH